MLAENKPVPVPLLVRFPKIVGTIVVPQHTPRAVILEPPSSVILPPLIEVVDVIEVTEIVAIVAKDCVRGTSDGLDLFYTLIQ